MGKKNIKMILLAILTALAIAIGIFFAIRNNMLENNRIQILDATYNCIQQKEKFYEDDKYIYYFPCIQSTSVFVMFPDGTKILVTKALEDEKVTIDELIKAGLEVIKEKK